MNRRAKLGEENAAVDEDPRLHRQVTSIAEELMLSAVRNHELMVEADRLKVRMEGEIAERKQAEEQLRGSLKALRDLQTAVDEHAIVTNTDPDGRITYANDKFCTLSKYPRQELLGQDHRIVNSGFHPKEFIRDIWTTIRQGRVWKGEIRDRAKDGTFYWMETTIVPCLDLAGKRFQYVGIRTDITARKNTEVELTESRRNAEHANRAKDEFIAALSHELRTPLTPILLIANELEADDLEPGMRSKVEQLRQNIELEAQLIDDLLDVTKIARGKVLLRPVNVDIHLLLRRALDTVYEDIMRKGIIAEVHADALSFHANADPIRIQQLFWNVIKNAGKFTPEGGKIQIRTFNPEPGNLAIEICDTGVGIASECLPLLFLPFEQGAATGIHRFGGLGLGMTIAKSIIELHGGSISAASEGIGKGATFTIRLPIAEGVTAAPEPPNVPRVESSSHLHILLVEDHEHTRAILARLLKREGHCVEAVGSCKAAGLAAKSASREGACPFQAIVSDLGLPDGSGLDLMREIRSQFPEINAIALSGYGTDDDIRRSAEAGFNQHLTKPIGIDILRRALADTPRPG